MEDKIRDKVVRAYDGVVLDNALRQSAKNKILAKERGRGKQKIIYCIVAAAAVVIFVLGNVMLIRLNLGHNKEAPVTETSSGGDENKSKDNHSQMFLADIQSREDLDIFALASNSYVLELQKEFYVAISCYDENGAECPPQSGRTAKIEYAYLRFGEQEAGEKTYQKNFAVDTLTVQDTAWKNIGAVYINDDWYEVRESAKEGVDHYYNIFNITSPEKSSYARHPEDAETTEHIRSNVIFFVAQAEGENGCLTVGRIENDDDEAKTGHPEIDSRQAPDYVLTYAKVSDAAKIKTSSVKSMGEHLFGDGHSLEEGKDI